MPQVACIMMQKDEGELLRVWIEYHSHLFGSRNLFLFDNGSTDPHTVAIMNKYKRLGLTFRDQHSDPDAHTKRNGIFADLISKLENAGHHDFYLPIDCDEMFILKNDNGITFSPDDIHLELDKFIKCDKVLGMTESFYNMLGKPDDFFRWPQNKVFFARGAFKAMDSGFHTGISMHYGSHTVETNFSAVHFQHKPYEMVIAHCKNKLRAFFDPDDVEQLKDNKERFDRLVKPILYGKDYYMSRFQTVGDINLHEFNAYLASIGISVPVFP